MEPALLTLAGWLHAIGLTQWARAVPWVYPAANVLHVLGVVMLLGGIGVLDLRVTGLWRRLPLDYLAAALIPLAMTGFIIQILSGGILFAADGRTLAASFTFQIKLVLILLALANVILFRVAAGRSRLVEPGAALRLSALGSLSLWIAVAVFGRLIAYY